MYIHGLFYGLASSNPHFLIDESAKSVAYAFVSTKRDDRSVNAELLNARKMNRVGGGDCGRQELPRLLHNPAEVMAS